MVAPIHAQDFVPALKDQRTLYFSQNGEGGYTVVEAPFTFDENFGNNLQLTDSNLRPFEEVDFEFPFFDNVYQSVYISNDGVISMGAEAIFRNYQLNFTSVPSIFPLLVDLEPEGVLSGGVFTRREADFLVITVDRVNSYHHQNETYTFQVVLYNNGEFSITYNGLPAVYRYQPNQNPEVEIWAIGVKPSSPSRIKGSFATLPIEIVP